MHFVASLVAVGSLASLASAGVGFQFPDSVPLSKRQVTGPAYECHANCGYAIQDAAKDGYCEDSKWKGLLSGCLDCALTYDIWKYYGDKVGAAAKKCGVDATPKPSGGSGGSASEPAKTTATESSAPASSAPASSSVPATQPPASSQPSAPGQPSQSATAPQTSSTAAGSSPVRSTSAATTGKPTASAAPTSGNNATSTQVQVGAASFQKPAMLAAGAVAVFAVNMI